MTRTPNKMTDPVDVVLALALTAALAAWALMSRPA